MSIVIRRSVSPGQGNEICAAQSIAAGVPLTLNGSLAQNNQVDFKSLGYSRQIAIFVDGTIPDNLEFRVEGKQNNLTLSELIRGPFTVERSMPAGVRTQIIAMPSFDSITSITPNITATNMVRVGVGHMGFFNFIPLVNSYKAYNLRITGNNGVGGGTNVNPMRVFSSLRDIVLTPETFADQVRRAIGGTGHRDNHLSLLNNMSLNAPTNNRTPIYELYGNSYPLAGLLVHFQFDFNQTNLTEPYRMTFIQV